MASNIGTLSQFATSNMKPDNGEQIDSLWGQNIADNTGYLYYLPQTVNFGVAEVIGQINGVGAASVTGTVGAGYSYQALKTGAGTTNGTIRISELPMYGVVPAHHNTFVGTFSYLLGMSGGNGTARLYYDGTLMGTVARGNGTSSGVFTVSAPIASGVTRLAPVMIVYAVFSSGGANQAYVYAHDFKFFTKAS